MAGNIRLTPGDAEAPREQWYVIAFSDEVTRAPRARMIMSDPVVLLRREDGTLRSLSASGHAAIERRQAHR
jgi:hypothetical protein